MAILEVKNISKSFDKKKIIDDVSFTISEGQIVGLLGKNSSGKTTILKMINDLLTIDSGEILVDGKKIGAKTKAEISFLPERSYLDNTMTVEQTLKFFKEFYKDFDKARAEKLLGELQISKSDYLSKMSKGGKEKLQLVLVMSRNAKLYILDEPLGGVDPSTRDYILKTIISRFSEKSCMLITTHLVADIEGILDRVMFLDKGKIVLNEDTEKLRAETGLSVDELFRRDLK